MSSKLPRVSAKEIIAVLKKRGFVLVRQSGSHQIYRNAFEMRVTVPFHGAKILHPKVLRSIMKDMDLVEEELRLLV